MDLVPVNKIDHVELFLRGFESLHTRRAYETDLQAYASFATGKDLFAFVTLSEYRTHLISQYAPATVIRKFSAVKSFFGFLASEGHIPNNPASNLRLPRQRTLNPTEAFSDEEVVRILSKPDARYFVGASHKLALTMLFSLGLRRSELSKLRFSDIEEHRGICFLKVRGKGGKERMIPLSSSIADEITTFQKTWVKTGLQMSSNTIYRIVKKYAKEAGITKRVSPHSCRATMISHLLEKEVSPRSVADLVGHSSISTTVDVYDKKRDALTNMTAFKVNYGG